MSSCPLGQRTTRRLWFLLLRRTLVLRLTVMDSWNALSVVARAYWFVELLVVFRAPSGWNAMIVYNVYIHVCIVDMNVLWTWSCMHLQLLPWSSIAKCRCCFAFTDFHELSLTVTTKPSWSPARLDFSLRPTVACPNHWAVNYGTWRKMPDLEAVDMGLSENNVMYIRIILSRMVFDIFWPYSPFAGIRYTLVYPFFQTHPYDHHKGSPIEWGAANRISHQSSSSTNCFMRHSASAARSASDMSIFSDLAGEGWGMLRASKPQGSS